MIQASIQSDRMRGCVSCEKECGMWRCRFLMLCCAGVFALSLSCPSGWADSRKPELKASEFDSLIERIRAAEADKSWQQPDWKDEALEAGLSKLAESVKATTGKEFLKLPAEFKDVSATRDPRANPLQGGLLRVAKGNLNVPFANKSIFLVDGSIHISHASDCIVVARGAVEISHGNRNLILAGHRVNIGHDGSEGIRAGARPGAIGDPPQTHGSLVFCGGSIDIAHGADLVARLPNLSKSAMLTRLPFSLRRTSPSATNSAAPSTKTLSRRLDSARLPACPQTC